MLFQDKQAQGVSLSSLPGIATTIQGKLSKLGLQSLYDLIFFLPFRYEDRTYVSSFAEMHYTDSPCLMILTITSSCHSHTKLSEFDVVDILGTPGKILFFHIPPFFKERLTPGLRILAFGNCGFDTFCHKPVMRHPEILFISNMQNIELVDKLSPIYHLTMGISQPRMRNFVLTALRYLTKHPLKECIPEEVNPFNGLTLNEALLRTHYPLPNPVHCLPTIGTLDSFRRICFEELVAYKLTILELKKRQLRKKAIALSCNNELHEEFLKTLPFTPTSAQTRVFHEIMADCNKTTAMSRLVHGDVGSGKTLVAAMVMLQCAKQGQQCVLLAPTDLLARQHARKIEALFKPFDVEVGLLNGALKKKERTQRLKQIASGDLKVIIGTHALFQKDVQYKNLAIAIIDEQHRFGIDQRESLLDKAPTDTAAHELLMTATPIPRSMQKALFAETDVSTLDVLPQGRAPIVTAVINKDRINEVIHHLEKHCSEGNQAYWVCPLVEEKEVQDQNVGSVKKRFVELQKILPTLKLGLLHGQLSDKAKTKTMESFLNGETQILIATSIVEVGVDVPNATVIIIEDAERLGLAQLHQLRGRVGRGNKNSFCILMYQQCDRDDDIYLRGIQRLEIMKASNNGFDIANQDLLMRGPGEFFGTNQAGKENFRFVDIERDANLLGIAQRAALHIFKQYPDLTQDLIQRWFPLALEDD